MAILDILGYLLYVRFLEFMNPDILVSKRIISTGKDNFQASKSSFRSLELQEEFI